MPKSVALIVLMLIGAVGLASGNELLTDHPGWSGDGQIRGYWSPPLPLFEPLRDAGFNTVIQRLELAVNAAQRADGNLHANYSFRDVENDTLASSQRARELDLRYFHCLDPGAASAVIAAGFLDNDRRFHDGNLPCPLDDVFWERVMTRRFLAVIDLLRGDDTRLDGLIIDPEMYALNGAFITIPCYCAHCARAYPQEKRDGKGLHEIEGASRADWLVNQGLKEAYEAWQQETVTARMAEMRQRIHEKSPNLILGFLIFRERPWFKAMAAGLSTKERPVLICTEGTYSGAFNGDYEAYQAGLAEKVGAPFLYCPGIWVGYGEKESLPTAFMEVVPGNVYHRTIRAAGYWVYAAYRWGGTGEKAKPFTDLFRTVNEELDRCQAAHGRYESELSPKPLPLERPGNLHDLLLEARDWQTVDAVPPTVTAPTGLIALRGQHQAVLNGGKGDAITVTLQNYQLGSYTSEGRIVIYNPGMEIVVDETCGVNQRIEATFTVDWEGPYVVLASAGSGVPNAFSLDIQGAPWVLSGDTIHFNKRGGRVYFWVPEALKTIELTLSGAGKETASFTLYSPEGNPVLRAEGVSSAQLHEVNSEALPGIWSLEISDIVDDGHFAIGGIDRFALHPAHVVTN